MALHGTYNKGRGTVPIGFSCFSEFTVAILRLFLLINYGILSVCVKSDLLVGGCTEYGCGSRGG